MYHSLHLVHDSLLIVPSWPVWATWSCHMKNENFSLPCARARAKLLSFLGPLPVADLCFSFCLSVSYGKQAPVIEVGAFLYY